MRKSKTVDIEGLGKPVTVYELTVQDVLDLMDGGGDDKSVGDTVQDFCRVVDAKLPRICTLNAEDLRRMAPSEMEAIWDAFKEVNSSFFRAASWWKLDAGLAHIQAAVAAMFAAACSSFSAEAMDSLSGPTDGAPSSRH